MTHIKQLKIKNYKSFNDEQIVDFTYPMETGDKSGLNIIVGPNNSGKSSIFDALLKVTAGKKMPRSERHGDKDVSIIIIDNEDKETIVSNNDGGHQTLVTGEKTIGEQSFEIIPSRRHWAHQFSGSTTWSQYSDQVKRNNDKNSPDGQFGRMLSELNTNKDNKKKEFNDLMRTLVPDFRDWTIDSLEEGQSEFVSYTTASGATHNTSLLGDGIISLFRIVAVLVSNTKDILLIDEPELSLHPQVLKRLIVLISKQSRNKQIIVSTHSPYFVDWTDIEAGAHIIRTNKGPDDFTTVKILKGGDDYLAKISGLQDYQKPQLLDLVAKEIFFSEAVVFVEGQEDVGLLQKYILDTKLDINFDFFGYGSGGAGNIRTFLELAKAMGVRAGAIFDGDKDSDYKACSREFGDYKIKKLSKPDIRDKFNRNNEGKEDKTLGLEKEGIFTSGLIKVECKDEVDKILKEFVDYFKPV